MMGGAKAHYDGIVAFSQTDFTEDLKKIIDICPSDTRSTANRAFPTPISDRCPPRWCRTEP